MNAWDKIQGMIIILFFVCIAGITLTGCMQVESGKSGAIYGAVTLTAQTDHSGVLVSARNGSIITQAITDKTGLYVITNLTSGTYEVTVSRNGWYVKDSAQPTRSIVITDGESVMNVDYVMDSDSAPPSIPH